MSHKEKAGIRCLLAKAKSKTEGLDKEVKGKYVYRPGRFMREKASSEARSKYGWDK